jgi:hypothetical protein
MVVEPAMKKSIAFGSWVLLAAAIVALVALPGDIARDIGWRWVFGIPAAMFLLAVAWNGTFKSKVQYIIATIIILVVVCAVKTVKRIGKWQKQIEEDKRAAPQGPPVAARSLDVAATHPNLSKSSLSVILGYDRKGRPITVDLGDGHTLVAGLTRTGKTNEILSILIQLCAKPKAQRPIIYIIDLKADMDEELYKFGAFGVYVRDMNEAMKLLVDLRIEAQKRFERKSDRRPTILIIDEVGKITVEGNEHRNPGIQAMKTLAMQAAGAKIHLVYATQYPRFDIIPKTITINFDRRICFRVRTAAQADVVLGYKPKKLPVAKGEFILDEMSRPKRGKSLLVQPGEIDELVAAEISDFSDWRYRLWKEIAANRRVGDKATGQTDAFKNVRGSMTRQVDGKTRDVIQADIRHAYRNYYAAGVLVGPAKKGGNSKIGCALVDGVLKLKQFIGSGQWQDHPEAVV